MRNWWFISCRKFLLSREGAFGCEIFLSAHAGSIHGGCRDAFWVPLPFVAGDHYRSAGNAMSRQQAMLESEMSAAREVQQIILPDAIEQMPGFSIESAYEPAQQVGGDFFQIMPAPKGSLLVVIGDVAGKGFAGGDAGVCAGGRDSRRGGVYGGARRTTGESESAIGGARERRLLDSACGADFSRRLGGAGERGTSGAVSRRARGGGAGALPLGASPGTRYETIRLQLPRGSRMTFYSDGIVEAQNREGELFGFERGRALSMEPVAAIVEAAKGFGQEDDITVIAITRDAEAVHEAAPAKQVAMGLPALAG